MSNYWASSNLHTSAGVLNGAAAGPPPRASGRTNTATVSPARPPFHGFRRGVQGDFTAKDVPRAPSVLSERKRLDKRPRGHADSGSSAQKGKEKTAGPFYWPRPSASRTGSAAEEEKTTASPMRSATNEGSTACSSSSTTGRASSVKYGAAHPALRHCEGAFSGVFSVLCDKHSLGDDGHAGAGETAKYSARSDEARSFMSSPNSLLMLFVALGHIPQNREAARLTLAHLSARSTTNPRLGGPAGGKRARVTSGIQTCALSMLYAVCLGVLRVSCCPNVGAAGP